eukprot:6207498-Pleurochrysis_carterae.AAC.1
MQLARLARLARQHARAHTRACCQQRVCESEALLTHLVIEYSMDGKLAQGGRRSLGSALDARGGVRLHVRAAPGLHAERARARLRPRRRRCRRRRRQRARAAAAPPAGRAPASPDKAQGRRFYVRRAQSTRPSGWVVEGGTDPPCWLRLH